MIDHTGIGVSDVVAAGKFYDAALGPLGLRRVMTLGEGLDAIGYGVTYPIFWVDRFHLHGVKQHVAFAPGSRDQVDDFHTAAVAGGGRDNGEAGFRQGPPGYPPGYYAAFVLDLDGNNIEAVWRDYAT